MNFLQRVEAKTAKVMSVKSATQAALKALDQLHYALMEVGNGHFASSISSFMAGLAQLARDEPSVIPQDKPKAKDKPKADKAKDKPKADKAKDKPKAKKKVTAGDQVREVVLPKSQFGSHHEQGIHLLEPTERELEEARDTAERDLFNTIFIYRNHGDKAAKQRLYLVR